MLVGADCAGVNIGRIALETLGTDAQLAVASEKDKATRAMLTHNVDIKPSQVSHDSMERDDSTLPHVVLYTAGPSGACYARVANHDALFEFVPS